MSAIDRPLLSGLVHLLPVSRNTCLAILMIGTAWAGTYSQSFTKSNNTTNLGDGSTISTTDTVASTASVQTNALRLTQTGRYGTVSSFKLPDLDPNAVVTSFDATWRVVVTKNGSEIPGEGWSLSFGQLPTGTGYGDRGFSMENGLAIGFDTRDSTADYTLTDGFHPVFTDPTSVQIFSGGIPIGNVTKTFPFGSFTDANMYLVHVHWDSNGLDVDFDSNHNGNNNDAADHVFTNLPTPNFQPVAGCLFAFSAATIAYETGGGASEGVVIDDVSVTTTTAPAAIPMETGGPVISEFVADNTDFEDEDADNSQDWIEIYNGQNASVNLAGWCLTDTASNPTQWTFPSITLGPYAYKIVYASSKNRTDPAGQLHTNFSLKKSGEYVALMRPNGTIASQYTFGPQVTNVSFGIAGPTLTQGYFYPATPGAANTTQQSPGQPAESPVWSRDGGLITGTVSVSIAPPIASGAVVRYTTNNTEPTPTSTLYSTPFNISTSTTLRARVFAPNQLPGPIVSRSFLRLDTSLTNYSGSGQIFSSNLPVLVLDSFGTNVDATWDPQLPRPSRFTYAVLFDSETTGRASLADVPQYQGRSGTNIRGNTSSALYFQRPYALKAVNEDGSGRNVSMLGMPADSDWVLYSPYIDRALLRDYLVYNQVRAFTGEEGRGMRCRFVEVFFNQTAGQSIGTGSYQGIYLLVEKIKIDKNRVDIQKVNNLTTDPTAITGGYLLRRDWQDPRVTTFTTPGNGSNYPGVRIQANDPEILNTAQLNYVQGYFSSFESALYGSSYANATTGYAKYIDTDTFIDNQWFIEMAKQDDGFVLSTYFTKDRGGKIRSAPAWDYDLSCGNVSYDPGYLTTGWYYNTTLAGDYTHYYWYPRLHQDPNYEQRHWDRYWMMRRGAFSTSTLTGLIDSTVNMLLNGSTTSVTNNMSAQAPLVENAVRRHFRKWPTLGTLIWPGANPGYTSRTKFNSTNPSNSETAYLKDWIKNRMKWIDDQNFNSSKVIFRPPNFSQYGDTVPGGYSLTISRYTGSPPAGYTYATGGTLYYTVDGSDPRLPGGAISPTALTYTVPIVINQSVTVKARLYKSGGWSPITDSTFIQSALPADATNLVISEMNYHPTAPTAQEISAGFTDPNMFEFIELFNVSSDTIDLYGCQFTDGITFDFGTANHSDLILPPGGHLVLANNPDALRFRNGGLAGMTIVGPYSGNLANGGELVTLLAADTSIIASFVYNDLDPWPLGADGAGYTLVLANPAVGLDYGDPTNWKSSAMINGSPGWGKDAQTIDFAPLADATFGDAPIPLNATSTSGLAVSLQTTDPTVATVTGGNVTIVGAGSTTIIASQAGDANYEAAFNVIRSLTVNKATATISLSGLSQTYDGNPKHVTVSTNPTGRPVVVTYEGLPDEPTAVGSYAVVATINDPNYQGGTTASLGIAKGTQTIAFAPLATATFGNAPFPLNATATSGLAVSYQSTNPAVATVSGGTVTIVGAGSSSIIASQAGDTNYNAAIDVPRTLTVDKATATVSLSGLSQTYDGSPKHVTATTNPTGRPVDITYAGLANEPIAAGNYAVVATINDPNYQGGSTATLGIAKATQTINFAPLAEATFGNAPLSLSATATSGLSISYQSSNLSVATISGSTVTIVGAGASTITASQAGDMNYIAADNVPQTLTVTKATATVSLSGLAQTYDGNPKHVTVTTNPTGRPVVITYEGLTAEPTNAGTYAVVATINDPNYSGSATGSLVIEHGNDLASWINEHFTLAEQTIGLADDLADPDFDGLPNFAEYALGTDPWDYTPPLVASMDVNGLTLTFTRPAGLPDVTYSAESSDRLGNWSPVPLEVVIPGDPETVRARDPLTTGDPSRRFIRLRFESP